MLELAGTGFVRHGGSSPFSFKDTKGVNKVGKVLLTTHRENPNQTNVLRKDSRISGDHILIIRYKYFWLFSESCFSAMFTSEQDLQAHALFCPDFIREIHTSFVCGFASVTHLVLS